jgi:hypothetical protein
MPLKRFVRVGDSLVLQQKNPFTGEPVNGQGRNYQFIQDEDSGPIGGGGGSSDFDRGWYYAGTTDFIAGVDPDPDIYSISVGTINGLALPLVTQGEDGGDPNFVNVSARDLGPLRVYSSNPAIINGTASPYFALVISGSPNPTFPGDYHENPADAILKFDCDSDATTLVEVWVYDPTQAEANFSETYVLIQDPGSACGGGE